MIGLALIGVGLAVGIVLVGVGLGIGRIGGQAVEGISRQPEAAGSIQTAMIISAALIEGVALFAMVILFLISQNITPELWDKFVKNSEHNHAEHVEAPKK